MKNPVCECSRTFPNWKRDCTLSRHSLLIERKGVGVCSTCVNPWFKWEERKGKWAEPTSTGGCTVGCRNNSK